MTLPPGSSDGSSAHNQFLGYCDLWNGYFIGTSIAAVFILCCNIVMSYRKSKWPTKGKVDWGAPWGIGLFLMNIALWSLVPTNVFFVMFKAAVPGLFPEVERMACIKVQVFPIITYSIVSIVVQVIFFYSPDGIANSLRPVLYDDDLLTAEGSSPPSRGEEGQRHDQRVLVIGAGVGHGRIFHERIRLRMAWLRSHQTDPDHAEGSEVVPFVAKSVGVVYRADDSAKSIAFMRNNFESLGADATCYDIVAGETMAADNMYGIPLADNSVDKVLISAFFRDGPDVGLLITPERIKAQRMSMLLGEALRVLKPGGRIVLMDSIPNVLLVYADLRDKLGTDNVVLDESIRRRLKITLFLWKSMWKVTATKPLSKQHGSSDLLDELPGAADSASEMQLMMKRASPNHVADVGRGRSSGDDGQQRRHTGASTVMAVMCPIQVVIFFALCFLVGAVYAPLLVPNNIPIGERVGNIFAGLATSYPGIAFMEREVVITLKRFEHPTQVLKFQLVSSTIAIISTSLLTALSTIPKLCVQLFLAQTSLTETTKAIIGVAFTLVMGLAVYKAAQRSSAKKLLKERGLDVDRFLKHLW